MMKTIVILGIAMSVIMVIFIATGEKLVIEDDSKL